MQPAKIEPASTQENASSVAKARLALAPEMIKLIRTCPRRLAITNDS